MSEKLQKVLARAGLGSRRQMEVWIQEGKVSVNGQVASLGDRIELSDSVMVEGKKVRLASEQEQGCRVIFYNKPEGELCTRDDPEGRKTVFDRLPKIARGRWIVIGRLDINTTGLLLFTNDGELANRLMHPSYEIDREYAVRVFGEVTPEIEKRLLSGVQLEDGPAKFDDLVAVGGEGINRWYHVALKEGRNREVRRLWESQELTVSRLIRVRMGHVELPRNLPQGGWREMDTSEVNRLREMVQLAPVEVVKSTTKERINEQSRLRRVRGELKKRHTRSQARSRNRTKR